MRRSNLFPGEGEKIFAVYILSNYTNKVLYTGFSARLKERVWQHKLKAVRGFTEKYNVNKLVYFEVGYDYDSVLAREKQIKAGSRSDKIKLVENKNPNWEDLYNTL